MSANAGKHVAANAVAGRVGETNASSCTATPLRTITNSRPANETSNISMRTKPPVNVYVTCSLAVPHRKRTDEVDFMDPMLLQGVYHLKRVALHTAVSSAHTAARHAESLTKIANGRADASGKVVSSPVTM